LFYHGGQALALLTCCHALPAPCLPSGSPRFSVEEDISSKVAIKSSAIRAIKQAVVEQFPAAEEYIDEVVPKKATVLEGKGCVCTRGRRTMCAPCGSRSASRSLLERRDAPSFSCDPSPCVQEGQAQLCHRRRRACAVSTARRALLPAAEDAAQV
jgi:hypothetical protein